MDTDVELIKGLDPIIKAGPFFACEKDDGISIAPGLGMTTFSGNPLYKKIINDYDHSHFKLSNGFMMNNLLDNE